MKRLMHGLAVAFAAGSLWADTAVWTKTDDQVENLWGWSWGKSTNWDAGYIPQTGDDVSLPTAPDAGVDTVRSLVAQEGQAYGNYSIGTLTGLSLYEIVLSLGSVLTVTDPSSFYGVFKVISNAESSTASR